MGFELNRAGGITEPFGGSQLVGKEPTTVHRTIHGPGYSGGGGLGAPYTLAARRRFSDAFHTFTVIWEPQSVEFWLMGILRLDGRADREQITEPGVHDTTISLALHFRV